MNAKGLAITAGLGAAAFVTGKTDGKNVVITKSGNGVRYVLPQQVHTDSGVDTPLFLRVTQPFGRVRFTVTSGDKVLAKAAHLKAAPGEMVRINIKADMLAQAEAEITVALEELA